MKALLLVITLSGVASAILLAGAHAVGCHGEIAALVCSFFGTTVGYCIIGYAMEQKK